jgi:hypothetical protein
MTGNTLSLVSYRIHCDNNDNVYLDLYNYWYSIYISNWPLLLKIIGQCDDKHIMMLHDH